jgi:hypothetical protein
MPIYAQETPASPVPMAAPAAPVAAPIAAPATANAVLRAGSPITLRLMEEITSVRNKGMWGGLDLIVDP